MKSQLVLFNGGLQTKTAEHLMNTNEAVQCINVNLDKGNLSPFGGWNERELVTATGTKPCFFNNTLITNSDEADNRSYALFGNRLYWSNGSFSAYGLLRWNGSTGVNAVAPTVNTFGASTATATGTGLLNETYSYVYTVVDTDGIESIPSPVFSATAVNQNIAISLDPTTVESVSETVAKRRVYRTGGSNPTFNLIAELDAPTLTYTDSTRDLDVSRVELSTFENYAPPANLTNLIEANGTMWGSVDNRVYYSMEGQPEFWNTLDFVVLNETCTGIGKYRDVVIAFTESNTYVISGYNRDNIALEKLPYNEGCLSHYSIANVTEMLVWTSKNGVCVFDGNAVQVVTRNILSWNKDAVVGSASFDSFTGSFDANIGYKVEYAIGLHGKYYAVYQDGIGVLDLDNKLLASTIELTDAKSLYYDSQENVLCAITSNLTVYSFNRDVTSKLTAQWRTANLTNDDYATLKQYRRVVFDTAPSSVIVYVDSNEVFSVDNKKDFYLPSGTIGRGIQFHISTNTDINSLRYEFGVING